MTIATGSQILAADVLNLGGFAAQVNVETLSATKTLANTDKFYQFLDPGGAGRTVTLPAAGAGNHPFFIINTADATELLTVQNASSVIIGYVARGQGKTFISDGTNWLQMDYAPNILKYVASDFSKTSDTTLATVTGLSADVVAGGVYSVRIFLNVINNALGGTKVALSGTCTVTAMRIRVVRYGDTAFTIGNFTALNSSSGETAVHRQIVLEGYVVVNAAGTLTVQAAQNASNASPTTIYAGSTMKLERMI